MTQSVKILAKKLFAKVHNLPVHLATVSRIKKEYPRFRASNKDHWELLILKLLGRNTKANKPATPQEQVDSAVDNLRKEKGIYDTYKDTFMVYAYRLSYKSVNMGILGYSDSEAKYFYIFGRNGRKNYTATCQQAVNGFLGANKYNVRLT